MKKPYIVTMTREYAKDVIVYAEDANEAVDMLERLWDSGLVK